MTQPFHESSFDESYGGFTSVTEALLRRSEEQAHDPACTFISDGEDKNILFNYRQLDRRVRSVAALLQTRAARGERAVLLYPQGMDYIIGIYACLYAGIIAVPAYPPVMKRHLARLEAIISDSKPTLALATKDVFNEVNTRFSDFFGNRRVQQIATDEHDDSMCDIWHGVDLGIEDLALLQYTSGSTGSPKGVMVSHGNLLANMRMVALAFGHNSELVWVSWVPLFHDMGLSGCMLGPLFVGGHFVLMSPMSFIKKPSRWLEAITRFRGTTSGAPNFAFDLCVDKITKEKKKQLDLNSWQVAFSAAEPVRADTLGRFVESFSACGLRPTALFPGYGLAEATVFTAGDDFETEPTIIAFDRGELKNHRAVPVLKTDEKAQLLVSCGRSSAGGRILVVDPWTSRTATTGRIGEIWIAGPHVTKGYWMRPDETAETFDARCADVEAGPFLRTGDLGFFHEDQLYVTGRLKDLIIVHGENYYPQDIEHTIEECHDSFRPNGGAAFSIDRDDAEKLVVCQEVERSALRRLDKQELVDAAVEAIWECYGLDLHALSLLKPGSLSRTSSGKVQRRDCRQQFLDGRLSGVVASWVRDAVEEDLEARRESRDSATQEAGLSRDQRSQADIQRWLVERLAQRLNISPDEIGNGRPFAHFGMNSLEAVRLSGELAEWLGRPLVPTLAYDYPNVGLLSRHLAGSGDVQPITDMVVKTHKPENELIAITGMACNFPGAPDTKAFWKLLAEGRDAISTVPAERWDADSMYSPLPGTRGRMISRWGGFLTDVDRFDAAFFEVSAAEAIVMDPQQRLLLETTWKALEDACEAPVALEGTDVGVFVGICVSDYLRYCSQVLQAVNAFTNTGNALSIAANRLSYFFDWRGPSLAIDTACSSSLVAVHQACRSLQLGECRLALAGGVNLMFLPHITVGFSLAELLSPDGRCKSFDKDANGYVRGEGCGVVVLKKLSDALRDRDRILAVVYGSAVNHDGRSNGLIAPNGLAQQQLVRKALHAAGVRPEQVSYVEAHGSGTALGDPIEMNALRSVLLDGRKHDERCWIGSVKTNIGHLESAAGIASLEKVVLSLQHEQIPPHLHLKELNPAIQIHDTPLSIPTDAQAWPQREEVRFAGVSSFGFGGTLAHIVLGDAPRGDRREGAAEGKTVFWLPLSAKSESALEELAGRYERYLAAHPTVDPGDVCFSASCGRTHHIHRLSVLASSAKELRAGLASIHQPRLANGCWRRRSPRSRSPRIVFLFTGLGAQYVGMGRELYETQPVFRRALDRCAEVLQPLLDRPLLELLHQNGVECESFLNETRHAHPALFSLEYALSELLRSRGIRPAAVIGHSIGEYVAACVAGVFSIEDGLRLVAERARLIDALPCTGAMVTILANESIVRQALEETGGDVSISAMNGPQNVAVSGVAEAVRALAAKLQAQRIWTIPVNDLHAFHSPLMQPMVNDFAMIASRIEYSTPRIPLLSNNTGTNVSDEVAGSDYWCRHITSPVNYYGGLNSLFQEGYRLFLEVGPDPVLATMGLMCEPYSRGEGDETQWFWCLRKGFSEREQLQETLARLYAHGIDIEFSEAFQDTPYRKIALPSYPFERKRYWAEMNGADDAPLDHEQTSQTSSPLVTLLRDGKTREVGELLEQSGRFSTSEAVLLPKILTELSSQARSIETITKIQSWFYDLQWQLKNLESGSALAIGEAAHWVVLADGGGVGDMAAAILRQKGHRCAMAYRGTRTRRIDGDAWELAPGDAEGLEQMLREVVRDAETPIRGVAHLWSLDAPANEELDARGLTIARELVCGTALFVLQTTARLAGSPMGPPPRLWFVTQRAVAVEGDSEKLAMAQSPLWGFGRTAALEHPEIWGGMIDLAHDETHLIAEHLVASLTNEDAEDQIVLRNGLRYVARLSRCSVPACREIVLRQDATYLITGGLGGIGRHLAVWLAEHGARCLVLAGRSGASQPAARETVAELERSGVKVEAARLDVSNHEQVVELIERIQATMPPLRGIVHAAGILADGILKELDSARFAEVMAPKVDGAWHLHRLSRDLDLDLFVLFSSVASLLGSPGQANYSAANAFLDSLAHYRQRAGLPALSINWGPWREAGFAIKKDSSTAWIDEIGPAEGMEAFRLAQQVGRPQLCVFAANWNQWQDPALHRLAMFKEVANDFKEKSEVAGDEIRSPFAESLHTAGSEQKRDLLYDHVRQVVSRIVGFEPGREPDPDQGFADMGMGSLMAIELRNRLQADLGITLSATLAFNYPTINALVSFLHAEISVIDSDPAADQGEPSDASGVHGQEQSSEDLSEDDLIREITEKYEKTRREFGEGDLT